MNFVWRQIKDIRKGGLPVLWKKIRAFPQWFYDSRYGQTLARYGYRLAVAFRPSDARAVSRLGRSLSQISRYNEAAACFKKIISLKPDFAEAHAQLAEMLIKLGHFDEAFAAWEQAFRLEPQWKELHDGVQNAYYFCGQMERARDVMQRVLDARNDFVRTHQLDKLGIRFLKEWPTAIGHTALLDLYVKSGIMGQLSPARKVLLVHPRLANPRYLDYWRHYLPDMITDPVALELVSPFAKYLEDHFQAAMDSSGKQIVSHDYVTNTGQATLQAQWEAEGRGPLLILTDSDEKRGWQRLQALGVPSDAWFVGLHVVGGRQKSRSARNADIGTYRLAIESIVSRGGWVIRMGDPGLPPLPPMPQVIDYAHSKLRIDWMDVFLWARCRFFIGVQSGPHNVPPTFGIPCVLTNWSSLGLRPLFNRNLCIYKLLWSEKEARYLSFAEVLSSPLAQAESEDYLATMGVKIVDNTPEEINGVVVEMLDRLEVKLQYSKEDEQLQERFDRLWTSEVFKATSRVGRDFLHKWASLQ